MNKNFDYKSITNDILKPNLEHLSNVRIIEFTNDMVKVSLDLRKKASNWAQTNKIT